jgi:hypothetical protein
LGIHAGRTGDADQLFLKQNVIALGWADVGDLSKLPADREGSRRASRNAIPIARKVTSGWRGDNSFVLCMKPKLATTSHTRRSGTAISTSEKLLAPLYMTQKPNLVIRSTDPFSG